MSVGGFVVIAWAKLMHRLPRLWCWMSLLGIVASQVAIAPNSAIAQEITPPDLRTMAKDAIMPQSVPDGEAEAPCVEVPVFDQHVGIWEGTYRYFDANGELTDVHYSRLELQRNCNQWEQTNTYMWDDGKTVTFSFPGAFSAEHVLTIDTPRLYGEAWESENTILLTWTYLDQPESQNFEMINLLSPTSRVRTWQLTDDGEVTGFVLISETRQQE